MHTTEAQYDAQEVRILECARSGNPEAGEELFTKYLMNAPAIASLLKRALVNPEDRKEMLHDIYVQLVSSRHPFRGDARLSTFIYQVARITIFQKYRRENTAKRKMILSCAVETTDVMDRSQVAPDVVYSIQENRRRVRRMIDELPDCYREVLRLRVLDEMSYEQIAGKMQLPVNTVSTKIHKGKRLLQAACNV